MGSEDDALHRNFRPSTGSTTPIQAVERAISSHAADGCKKCAEANAKKTGQTSTIWHSSTQLGPVSFERSYSMTTGNRYFGVAIGPPGVGETISNCTVRTAPGQTEEDAITGWSVGASAGTPGFGPAVSSSANMSGSVLCKGLQAGSGGPGAGWSMTALGDPTDLDPAAELKRAQTQAHEEGKARRERAGSDAKALREMDPKNYVNGVFKDPGPK
jgi:hypothetical protein